MATKKTGVTKSKVALGALATAAAAGAAVAGYYFYASKDAKQNRQKAAKWARDMQKDVMTRAKKLKDVDRAQLAKIVDEAASAYRSMKNVDPSELKRAAKELKDNWQLIAADLAGTTVAKKAAKTVAKGSVRATSAKTKKASRKA